MLTVYEESEREHRKRGWPAFFVFALRELVGLVVISSAERLSNVLNSNLYLARDRSTPDQNAPPYEVMEAQQHVEFILSRMEYAIAHHQFEKARLYSDEEYREREKLRLLKEQYRIKESR